MKLIENFAPPVVALASAAAFLGANALPFFEAGALAPGLWEFVPLTPALAGSKALFLELALLAPLLLVVQNWRVGRARATALLAAFASAALICVGLVPAAPGVVMPGTGMAVAFGASILGVIAAGALAIAPARPLVRDDDDG